MSVALLDVNVLVALLFPAHQFHLAASVWFDQNRSQGWATCAITQAGFVRLFSQSGIVGREVSVRDALSLLEQGCSESGHRFWAHEHAVFDLLPEIRTRLIGHQQLTDAILLDLAIRNQGRLVTLDKRVEHLLPGSSPNRAAVEVIPV